MQKSKSRFINCTSEIYFQREAFHCKAHFFRDPINASAVFFNFSSIVVTGFHPRWSRAFKLSTWNHAISQQSLSTRHAQDALIILHPFDIVKWFPVAHLELKKKCSPPTFSVRPILPLLLTSSAIFYNKSRKGSTPLKKNALKNLLTAWDYAKSSRSQPINGT